MKWIAWVIGAVVVLVVLIGIIGLVLPRQHVATVRIVLNQPIERVFDLISDIPGGTKWRSDLKQVEILSGDDTTLRWKETTGFGTVIMAREESQPPDRLVSRIDDPDQPFSGRWIHELDSTTNGTVLTITEEGAVSNIFFRFMSRFVFGHYRTLEAYARDLARHFGESSKPIRVLREH